MRVSGARDGKYPAFKFAGGESGKGRFGDLNGFASLRVVHSMSLIKIWVRLFSAKKFRLSRCHFEFIILRYRNIIALVLLTVVKDHVVLKITASAKGA